MDINISQRPISFEKINSFLLGELKKYFSLQIAPQGGRFFCSGTLVPLLEVLYAWPVFRSNLVLFLFHLIAWLFFFFYSSASCFHSLWSNLYFVVHSMQKRWLHQMNSCYQKCLNKNHHLMNTLVRRLSHQFQTPIRCLVTQ